MGANGCFTDGTCTVCVTVVMTADKKSATVTVTGGTISDVDIKGGSSRSTNGHCTDGDPNSTGTVTVINVPEGGAGISFVGGVICPTC